ncbi:hypothetical protein [Paraburkholderia sp. SIMBA_054]|uniref:hypothetical protein n=1 Tax=Paraburkholderia sp. SIMBA_054 TaxID=3085795 RepID=UPI00397C9555
MNVAIENFAAFETGLTVGENTALSIHCGFALASMLGNHAEEAFCRVDVDGQNDWAIEAYVLGMGARVDDDVPEVFKGTRLAVEWLAGRQHAEEMKAETISAGSLTNEGQTMPSHEFDGLWH